jgi:glucokinase-like ROK family protein
MPTKLESLHHQLIVSCQAYPNDPMEDTATLARVAQSALLGGAKGLRVNSAEHVRAMRVVTNLPIIAIQKSYEGGALRITPDFASAAELAAAGADIIALDCTDRVHLHGEPWREIIRRIHAELNVLVMADIATLREGLAAAAAGVDLIGTTLNGYTEETRGNHHFSCSLVTDLARETGKPIVAEGHISTPAEATKALACGAWCVVIGSAITRPGTITEGFVKAMQSPATASNATRYVLGIDIGGTAIKAAIVNDRGETSLHARVPTLASGGRDVIAKSMLDAVQQTLSAAEKQNIQAKQNIKPLAIGVASAGAIDSKHGTVFAATENLPGWAGFDLRGFLKQHTALPVFVENDAHAAALAELHYGAGRGLSNFIAITLGTGVGGGIVLNKQLQRGQYGFAGTVGHQVIRVEGIPCNCGRHGCLEAYVSTVALVREYASRQTDPSVEFKQALDDAARAMQIATLAIAGDKAAKQAYSALANYLAEGIANLFNILDPEAVILSGGLIEGHATFLDEVKTKVASLLHFGSKRPPILLRAGSSQYAGVQGAAAAAFEGLQ